MRTEVNRYLTSEEGKADLKKAVDSILTPDNYHDKALQQLVKAAHILKYCKFLGQEPTHNQAFTSASLVKLIAECFIQESVTDEDVEKQRKMVDTNLSQWSTMYRSDKDYPTIK